MVLVVARAVSSDERPHIADLVGVVISAAALALSLRETGRQSSARTYPAGADALESAKEVLAEQIARQWGDEAVLRSLDDPAPIPVRWSVTEDTKVMDRPENLTPASLYLSGSSADVAALAKAFRALRRRRLVILGGPGSGKTTLAVLLVRELVTTRAAGEPVPVLLSLAGWDAARAPRLHEWVAERLADGYPLLRAPDHGPDMPRRLATGGHILPVLDGLDELPASAQAAVITALNRYLGRDDQIILTCRSREYAEAIGQAGDVLTSALVIRTHPVDPRTAAGYLRSCLPPEPGQAWEKILAALTAAAPPSGPSAALAEMCATPLGLWLLRTVYAGTRADVTPLLDSHAFPDAAALRAHLYDHLVGALIATRDPSVERQEPFRPRRRHDPDRVRRWLAYLAHLMSHPRDGSPPTRDFAWWQLARATGLFTTATRVVVGLVTGLMGGVVAGLVFGLMVGLELGPPAGLALGSLAGAVVGLMVGLLVWSEAASWQHKRPGFAALRVRGRGPSSTLDIVIGLVGGLGIGLVTWLAFGLWGGVLVGPGIGIAAGIVSWMERPARDDAATTPMSGWRADRVVNLLRAAMTGIVFGLTGGIAGGLEDGPAFGLAIGIVCAFVGGLGGALVGGRHRAWPAYLVVTYRLAFAGLLPRALMPFLDDVHRLGLLRAVGPFYQFRHAELQDHLAGVYEREYRAK
ncbi:NACHT domain-containing protein [Thermopolyspora flexuosa]|nr:NACHT domain-containing protein [Thermopolyspora flexuosa]GGM72285.1 NACHT domain-containing protein [Thermopolyspora flexuosa]